MGAETDAAPSIFVLSARNEERLKIYARVMRDFLRARVGDVDLRDFIYTLQVGDARRWTRGSRSSQRRAAISKRSSAHMSSSAQCRKIASAGPGRHESEGRGVAAIDGAPARLAEALGGGQRVEWDRLYAAAPPRRVAAPTYPFLRERYWIAPGELGKKEEFCKGRSRRSDCRRPVPTRRRRRRRLKHKGVTRPLLRLTAPEQFETVFASGRAKPAGLLLTTPGAAEACGAGDSRRAV